MKQSDSGVGRVLAADGLEMGGDEAAGSTEKRPPRPHLDGATVGEVDGAGRGF
jgi:hypothetical protein